MTRSRQRTRNAKLVDRDTPLPPDVLANALQDPTGPTSGKLIKATPVKPVDLSNCITCGEFITHGHDCTKSTYSKLVGVTQPVKERHEDYLRRLVGNLHGDCAAWNLSPADIRYVLEGVASRVRDAEQAEKRRKDKEEKK